MTNLQLRWCCSRVHVVCRGVQLGDVLVHETLPTLTWALCMRDERDTWKVLQASTTSMKSSSCHGRVKGSHLLMDSRLAKQWSWMINFSWCMILDMILLLAYLSHRSGLSTPPGFCSASLSIKTFISLKTQPLYLNLESLTLLSMSCILIHCMDACGGVVVQWKCSSIYRS